MTRQLPERVLEYSVPLFVVVSDDGDGKYRVSKVVVYDEHTLNAPLVHDDSGRALPAHVGRRSKRLHEIIAAIAQGIEEFPSWDFGW